MRNLIIAALAAVSLAGSAQALTVETGSFITNVTNFNGFEGLGAITGADGVTSYTEDGITVEYVGSIAGGGIWSQGFAAPEGQYSWYPDGGGTGYTRITFDDANQIEFFAGSGFFLPPVSLAYEVLLDGVLIGTGVAGLVPEFGAGFTIYGFSGELFDEVRLQGVPGATGFDPNAFEALALDGIALGTTDAVIPEPATWALMIAGFGMVGASMRRRVRAVAA